ncbi:NAD(+) synthase [Pseudomonadales bacterium]|nr:NAD(+) synthase [Pseudomonadales bacterium]
MNRISNYHQLSERISTWLSEYIETTSLKCFVVGVSGGVDSAVASTLAAETGHPVYALGMPIHQKPEQQNLSDTHLDWLDRNYSNVIVLKYDLTNLFESFRHTIGVDSDNVDNLSLANTRSRLRMATLYQIAGRHRGLVVGTGNKVEDYGVGFYTKYGDGGVDIAPIADLYKTEVWELGKFLGVDSGIIEAQPTDGLWDDGRTDEDQLGASYELLEWVMDSGVLGGGYDTSSLTMWKGVPFTDEQRVAVTQYLKFNTMNQHKMQPIPTFKL